LIDSLALDAGGLLLASTAEKVIDEFISKESLKACFQFNWGALLYFG
jgi:hypothetical protein